MKRTLDAGRKREERLAWALVAPFVIFFAIFKLWPMIYGFAVSFLDRNSVKKLTDTSFVMFRNYGKVLKSPGFWSSFGHTIVYSLIYVTVLMVVSFFLANLLNRTFKGRTVVRTCFYMPYVTNVIAIGIVFKYLLNPTRGPVNAIWRLFGAEGPKWLTSPTMALPVTALIGVWVALAFNVITILAALQEIPKDLFEVADLEGASWWCRMKDIVFPMIAPALFMLLTITVINSFKNYTMVTALTGGGPGSATRVLSLQIYDDAFQFSKFSIASAEGVLFTMFIIVVNRVITRARNRWEVK